jgi:branched-subunit amino acid ABC-type transport system permease component
MLDLLHGIGFGLLTASILAIATVAVSMQHSVTQVPNFAQGDIMTVGAYAAYASALLVNNLLIAAVCACLASALISFLLNWGLIQPFLRAGTKTVILFVLTIGASFIIQNLLVAYFGSGFVFYKIGFSAPQNVGPFLWTGRDEAIMAVAAASLISVHVVLKYTKFGKAQRAVADSQELARVSGINSGMVINLTWLWAGAMTGLAGFVLALQVGTLTPYLGYSFLLVVFASAIVGGIGQIYGAMIGALLIGLSTEISAVYLPADYKQAVAFLALVLALLLRPDGIIPSPSRRAVQL